MKACGRWLDVISGARRTWLVNCQSDDADIAVYFPKSLKSFCIFAAGITGGNAAFQWELTTAGLEIAPPRSSFPASQVALQIEVYHFALEIEIRDLKTPF